MAWVSRLQPFGKRKSSSPVPAVPDPAGQLAARPYCLAAVTLFAIQGMVALLGALDLVIPDLPSPVPFEYGRSIHLNLSVLWPLIGIMGIIYYMFGYELGTNLFSAKLARWQFWLVFLSSLTIFSTLAFRMGNGREYLDGLPVLYGVIALSLALAAYNLFRTLAESRRITPSSVVITAGISFAFLFLAPNLFRFSNPIADEAIKYWVVHLWEEMAFEFTSAGITAVFLKMSGMPAKDVDKWVYLELSLAAVTGLFSTGHHYYWIGFPAFWLLFGALFSALQLTPVGLLLLMVYKSLKHGLGSSRRIKLALWLNLSSVFYHATGAALLGVLISVPWINLYEHGTYITSAHAHFALFGSLGFLVLGGCYFTLSNNREPSPHQYRQGIAAVLLLNTGLFIMSGALMVAGLFQAYGWRYLGLDFMQVDLQLSPFLIARAAGGSIFTLGDLLLFWVMIKAWKSSK